MMQRLLIGLVKAYRLLLSPWLGSACRFEPTCSVYALQALGAAWRSARGLADCLPPGALPSLVCGWA
jgi:putative component of membrane protein insertase Oxa1/YidC/SpoIIIJ protein YidD